MSDDRLFIAVVGTIRRIEPDTSPAPLQMTDELALHVLRRPDLQAGKVYSAWERGDEIARPSPAKRALMLSNPLSLGPDEPMQIIGTKGSRVIGRIDLIAGRIVAGEVDTPVLWGSEYFVPKEDRDTMMGVMLLMKTQQVFHTVGAHGPSQMAYPLYSRLKWADVPLQRFILLRRARSIVRHYVGRGALGLLARLGAEAALAALRATHSVRGATLGLAAREVPKMPSELDAALASPSAKARGHRSAAWINWLLANHFGGNGARHERRLFLVTRAGSSEPVGYFLLKIKFLPVATHRGFADLTLASLADARTFDPARCGPRALAMLAFREASLLGADALEVCAGPTDPPVFTHSMGFLSAGQMHLMLRAASPSPLADPRWRRPENWDIRLGDGEYVPN